ncbi:succinylglutamate desuccinylase/aspartoacylase family protein [Fusobacterium perfoetens]|uniref:M14 family metallopeptidase n=1 Tax=Fusobacterium perfoetens TaxID=852 RepID=UPI001F1D0BA4|nr:M14 family metallopeptidase [Fusobacterium perfoetens]MCF2625974.1 succinylglutamate desuccinylase/aspartoacylase family protein [Fusobacterium perfoetens]
MNIKETINYGGLIVSAGEKKTGFAKVLDTDYNFPLTVINGSKEGKTLLITSGIHGGEYPCIEAAIELAQEIDPQKISGQIIIIHPVNISAYYARISYILPEDGKNINRLFPGNPEGTLGDKIAYVLTTEYQDKADFYLDIHGGDIHEYLPPYVYYPGIGENKDALAYAELATNFLNAKYKVKSSATTGAYNSAAIRGIPSLLIERGGRGLWSKEEVENYKNDIKNIMRFLQILPETPISILEKPTLITKAVYLDATTSGCWYPCVKLEERVKKGQKIGEIKDVFGKTLAEYYSDFDSIILFMTTSLAINKDDPIITYGI